jgi:hypothetical protein
MALVTTSIYRVPFLVSRCFLRAICFIRLQSDTPNDNGYNAELVRSFVLPGVLFLPNPTFVQAVSIQSASS